jgi:hypothetical protein
VELCVGACVGGLWSWDGEGWGGRLSRSRMKLPNDRRDGSLIVLCWAWHLVFFFYHPPYIGAALAFIVGPFASVGFARLNEHSAGGTRPRWVRLFTCSRRV